MERRVVDTTQIKTLIYYVEETVRWLLRRGPDRSGLGRLPNEQGEEARVSEQSGTRRTKIDERDGANIQARFGLLDRV